MPKKYSPKDDIDRYREEAISIAEDLGYSKHVITKLQTARNEIEISNILTDARNHEDYAHKRKRR